DRLVASLTSSPKHGALAAVQAVDTIKRVDADGVCQETPPRDLLWHAQTPQAFPFAALLAAHEAGEAAGPCLDGASQVGASQNGASLAKPRPPGDTAQRHSDDTSIFEWHGGTVRVIEGARTNFKLTRPEDFVIAEALLAQEHRETGISAATSGQLSPVPQAAANASNASGLTLPRIGSGYDVHALGPGDGVMLCGVHIPHTQGLVGHSDADVGLHALVDALLGAVAAGDIGTHFPPRDPQWRGAASSRFVTAALEIVADRGYRPHNVDLTLICERPKIGPHRAAMRRTLCELLGLEDGAVSIKATTSEGLGFTGRQEGIAAQAHVLVAPL
ncbi:MAG: 2-C-methyl-D-erythritol 2,4-cyclodiphosphate synthase, partial [Pseudomonadota bacterium]